jgi:hypothetical protein
MKKYIFKYRRGFFWKKVAIIGHNYEEKLDKMILFLPDGEIMEIPHWRDYFLWLGQDAQLALTQKMEQEAGQKIPVRGN